jgi:hypothetical protein
LKSAPPVPPVLDGVVVVPPPVDDGVVGVGVAAPPVFCGVVVAVLGVIVEDAPPVEELVGVLVVAVVVVDVVVVDALADVAGVPPVGGAVRSGTVLGTL